METIIVSGGLDPLHIGHIMMLNAAKGYGKLIVLLNSDAWLIRKKGFYLLPIEERIAVIASMAGVAAVYEANDDDDTVCKDLAFFRPTYFANGGDRTEKNTPEKQVCEDLGIKMLYGIGGDFKANSSTDLFVNALKLAKQNRRLDGYLRQIAQ